MDEYRREVYARLKENADKLRVVLSDKEFDISKADKLFRERNSMFLHLKDVFVADNIDEEETALIEEMINDNNELLSLVEKKKSDMEKKFNKKRTEAEKISQYLKG